MIKLTLHEAIRDVLLRTKSRLALTAKISEEIKDNGSYVRKDGKAPRANQINARVRCHSEMFEFAKPGLVRLIGEDTMSEGRLNEQGW